MGTFIGGFLWSPGAIANGVWMWAFAGTAGFYAVNTVLYYRWFWAMDDRPAKLRAEVDAVFTSGVGPVVK